MMLSHLSESASMTPWEVIQEALAHRKPPKNLTWLAGQLGGKFTVQRLQNWKTRGVPPAQYRAVAGVLGITVDQLEGLHPLPWDRPAEWPFEDRDLFDRVRALEPAQRLEIQGAIRSLVQQFEQKALEAEEDHSAEDALARKVVDESTGKANGSRVKILPKRVDR